VSAPAVTNESSPEAQLAWERRYRGRAAICSVVAGVLLLGAPFLLLGVVNRNYPTVGPLQALEPALNGTPQTVDPRWREVLHLHDHATGLILFAVLTLIGLLALTGAMVFLFNATRARRPELQKALIALILVGPVLVGVITLATEILTESRAAAFASGTDHSHAAVQHVFDIRRSVALGTLGALGQFATAVGIVIVSLNAMRVGLLTRFMGVLGMISGVLFILPIIPVPIVLAFWLVALGALFVGRWPNGVPPAWASGRAELWPTQQEMRERSVAERNRREALAIKDKPAASEEVETAGAVEGAEPVRPAHPRSNKRKRKRR